MAQASVAVIGAGVFGGFTALNLLERGARVSLIEPWGPGHSRASSGGESRVIRATYGPREIYTAWVVRSLELWKQYQTRWGQKLYHQTGGLWLAGDDDDFEKQAVSLLRKHGVRFDELTTDDAARRFPQICFGGVRWAIYERDAGYLLARRACQAVQEAFIEAGGTYIEQAAKRAGEAIVLSDGETLRADSYVFACGPWLSELFPELGRDFITPTRQEIYYFGTPKSDTRYNDRECPIWIDNSAEVYYGIPGTEWRGFKIACDSKGERVEPTTMDRAPRADGIAAARAHMEFRFPGMKDAPLVEARVCQYEMSADENFIIDRHPDADNVWLVGGGSGHGFKHGPALGEHVAAAVLGAGEPDPLFRLSRF